MLQCTKTCYKLVPEITKQETVMAHLTDLNPRSVLFDRDNPIRSRAERTHRRFFEAADRTARVHIDIAGDLLDLNRKGLDALFESESFGDSFDSHRAIAREAGNVLGRYALEMKDVATGMLRRAE